MGISDEHVQDMSKHYLTHFFRFFPFMYQFINIGQDIRPAFDKLSEEIV